MAIQAEQTKLNATMARFIFKPFTRRGKTKWCVEVKGLIHGGDVDIELCGPGLGPEIIDWFFQYRQSSLERFVTITRIEDSRGHKRRIRRRRVWVDIEVRSFPLPAHFLLAIFSVATVRSREKRKRLVECFARLDPLEPLSPRLYEIVDEVLSTGGRIRWRRLVKLSRCIRCWC